MKKVRQIILLSMIFVIFFLCTLVYAEDKKIIDTEFIMVSSYLVGMTVLDVETTFASVRNGAEEGNALMKPFVKRGRLATYGVQLGVDVIVIYLAYKMKGSSQFGKVWWIAPSVVGTAHGVAGGLNLRYCW